jgi:hypothetical protein
MTVCLQWRSKSAAVFALNSKRNRENAGVRAGVFHLPSATYLMAAAPSLCVRINYYRE